MSDTNESGHSESVENFLKAIYALQQKNERVSTNTLAEALAISAPSVTDMAQRMVKDGLVDYQKYRGVVLTPAGVDVALKVIRRHRLIELYLVVELGYELHEVHDEAENLEHAVSDRFIEAIARKLGQPELDPHGDPIPTAEGVVAQRDLRPLSEWPENLPGKVAQLSTDNPEMLRHMLDRGLKLDATVEVTGRDPFEGPMTVTVDGLQRVIGHGIADHVMVDNEDPQDGA
jgi:DtxR family transcriptional regulator, Mn-dependent transcriptional regulator